MKQFNLEEYNRRIVAGETPEIVTRDGHKARIICTDRKDDKSPIMALVLYDDGHEAFFSYSEEGKIYFDREHHLDLFFAPRKKTIKGWVNVYKYGFGGVWNSEEEALRSRCNSLIKTIEISTEIEEE